MTNKKKPGKTRKILGLSLTIAVFFTACSNSSSHDNSQNSQINRDMVPPPIDLEDLVVPVEVEDTNQVTLESFDKIKNGMSLEEVESIILGNSTLISSKTVNGKLNETYRWEVLDPPAYIEVRLVQNKVVAKSQKGLN